MEIRNLEGIKNVTQSPAVNNGKAKSLDYDNKYIGETVTAETLAMDPRARIAEAAIKLSQTQPKDYNTKLSDIADMHLKETEEQPMTDEEAKVKIQELLDTIENLDGSTSETTKRYSVEDRKRLIIKSTTTENFEIAKICIEKYKNNFANSSYDDKVRAQISLLTNIGHFLSAGNINEYNKDIALKLIDKNDDKSVGKFAYILQNIDSAEKKELFENSLITEKPIRIYLDPNFIELSKNKNGEYEIKTYSQEEIEEIQDMQYGNRAEQDYAEEFFSVPSINLENYNSFLNKTNKYNKDISIEILKNSHEIIHFIDAINDETSAKFAKTLLKNGEDKYYADKYRQLSNVLRAISNLDYQLEDIFKDEDRNIAIAQLYKTLTESIVPEN